MTDNHLQFCVIGNGRVGTALASQSRARGIVCHLVGRAHGWQHLQTPAGAPIVVCTRNDDLPQVLAQLPPHRRADVVIVQNGMIRPWLREQGLTAVTRGLLFFAVAQIGDAPQPGGMSPLTGPLAATVAQWWQTLGLPAACIADSDFRQLELEKLLWNCCLGALCQAYSVPVGLAVTVYATELAQLVAELAPLAAAELQVPCDSVQRDSLVDNLRHYSLSIADYRATVKEWRWRNGWFVDAARQQGRQTPMHSQLLRAGGIDVA